MAYATKTDIVNERLNSEKLLELERHDTGEGDLDARTEAALADASARIDAYLGRRYALPISDEGALALVKGYALDLAVYYLYLRYFGGVTEEQRNACLQAVGDLKKLSTGELALPGESARRPIETSADRRRMTMRRMRSV